MQCGLDHLKISKKMLFKENVEMSILNMLSVASIVANIVAGADF